MLKRECWQIFHLLPLCYVVSPLLMALSQMSDTWYCSPKLRKMIWHKTLQSNDSKVILKTRQVLSFLHENCNDTEFFLFI